MIDWEPGVKRALKAQLNTGRGGGVYLSPAKELASTKLRAVDTVCAGCPNLEGVVKGSKRFPEIQLSCAAGKNPIEITRATAFGAPPACGVVAERR